MMEFKLSSFQLYSCQLMTEARKADRSECGVTVVLHSKCVQD